MSSSSKWPQPVRAFEYPSVLGGPAAPAQRKVEDDAVREAHIREHAQREAESRLREEFDKLICEERKHVRKAVSEFVGERETYFRRAEEEVVQLALAIARRVLHREAKLDPMVLAGVVRVALDNLRAATEIKLHVCVGSGEQWRTMLESVRTGKSPVVVVEEPAFAPSQCLLESSLGAVELGIDDQLKEIEQGFFDLLAARPR